jgi:hypothetical protein
VVKTDPDLLGLEAAQVRTAAMIWCETDLDSEREEVVRQREQRAREHEQATWMW